MADNENGQDRPETPLDALGIMASQQAILGPNLRQVEMYTRRGLLSLLWHEPDTAEQKVGVVMVGGATRMPHVQRAVAGLFGQPPLTNLDPDKVVALGAAMQASGRAAED